MGTAALFGLTVMIVSIPLHHYMGKKYHRIQERLMTARDRRTELLNELLHGIRMVKAFAWERKWEEKILVGQLLNLTPSRREASRYLTHLRSLAESAKH